MKINLSKRARFAAAIVAQMAIVIGLIAINASLLIRGTPVTLAIHPVDPRDPLRGDYVTLAYDISSVNLDLADNKDKLSQRGATVYVVLANAGDHWEAVGLKSTKPGDGQLFIRGTVSYADSSYSYSRDKTRNLHITYGIEDYFVPEGTGGSVVSQIRTKQTLAQVVIDRDGNSVLKSLIFGSDIRPKAADFNNQTQAETKPALGNAKINYPNDDRRRQDIALIRKALSDYYVIYEKYPLSGGAAVPNSGWSTSNTASWNNLQKALSPYLAGGILPKDPVNDSAGWPGDGGATKAYAYYSQEYGCSQQWYMIVANYDEPDIASPGVTACDGTKFNYGGAMTVGICKSCGSNSGPILPPQNTDIAE